MIATTNAIESINALYRRAIKAKGHFPNEASALKCLYMVTPSLDPTGGGKARWAIRCKPALNAFAITFAGRLDRAIHLNRRTSHTVGRTDPRPVREGLSLRWRRSAGVQRVASYYRGLLSSAWGRP